MTLAVKSLPPGTKPLRCQERKPPHGWKCSKKARWLVGEKVMCGDCMAEAREADDAKAQA